LNATTETNEGGGIHGNVFLLNPYGSEINGTVNADSFTTITPTFEFMEGFFESWGNPDEDKVQAVLNGTVPTAASVPESATMFLSGTGIAGLVGFGRK